MGYCGAAQHGAGGDDHPPTIPLVLSIYVFFVLMSLQWEAFMVRFMLDESFFILQFLFGFCCKYGSTIEMKNE